MAYKYNGFDAEKEITKLKGDISTLRAALKHQIDRAKKPEPVDSGTPKYAMELAQEVIDVRDSNARIRARMRKLESVIEDQNALIEQMQEMVAQLIERGRIPCQDSSHSSPSPPPSLRLVSPS